MGEIRRHRQEDCRAVSEFFEKNFADQRGGVDKRSRSPEYYAWRYGPNPFGESFIYHYWEGGKILGLWGGTPEPLVIRGEKITGYQHLDAFVAPELQGRGVFKKIADQLFEDIDKASDLSYGYGPSPRLLPILREKYNHYVGTKYRQVFGPLRLDQILRAKGLGALASIGRIANFLKNEIFRAPSSIEIEEVKNIDPSFFIEPTADTDLSMARDREWVDYRYVACPEPYRFFTARDKRHALAVVVKFVSWRNLKICYLIDVIGDMRVENIFLFVMQALLKIGIETGSAFVSAEVDDYQEKRFKLHRNGFVIQALEQFFVVRQHRWPFLDPSSTEYDIHRWNFLSLDADYI